MGSSDGVKSKPWTGSLWLSPGRASLAAAAASPIRSAAVPGPTVILSPYDPQWPATYAREAELIRGVLGDRLLAVHHIGSTAVPGMTAKPIVDILGVVRDVNDLEPFRDALATAGYLWQCEYGVPGRRYFDKYSDGSPMELSHLHCYGEGHPAIAEHLRFRDRLRSDPDAAARYVALKQSLRAQFTDERRRYTQGKGPFIQQILRDLGPPDDEHAPAR